MPLNRHHLAEVAAIIIDAMPTERKNKIPFSNGKPVIRWVRNFYARHQCILRFAVSSFQEGKRFAAVNGTTLAKHFAVLEALYEKYGLDAQRIWNLEESGISPGRDAKGKVR